LTVQMCVIQRLLAARVQQPNGVAAKLAVAHASHDSGSRSHHWSATRREEVDTVMRTPPRIARCSEQTARDARITTRNRKGECRPGRDRHDDPPSAKELRLNANDVVAVAADLDVDRRSVFRRTGHSLMRLRRIARHGEEIHEHASERLHRDVRRNDEAVPPAQRDAPRDGSGLGRREVNRLTMRRGNGRRATQRRVAGGEPVAAEGRAVELGFFQIADVLVTRRSKSAVA
jgi:hypothetical protein